MPKEKKQWRAFFWNEDKKEYVESTPISKCVAKLMLSHDPACHFIRKVEGWFRREIWKDESSDVKMPNITVGGDVAGRELIKHCKCNNHAFEASGSC